jgi:hypothetical protein
LGKKEAQAGNNLGLISQKSYSEVGNEDGTGYLTAISKNPSKIVSINPLE